ncbi:hypothetical protein Tco_0258040 [Tanacetum coccineum]
MGLTAEMRQYLALRLRMVYSGEGQQEEDDAGSDRLILDKGDLRDYWMEISSDRDFLGPTPSYVLIQDLVRLNICMRYGDTWAWVAQGPERQQATAAGAHEADEAGLEAEEGS